MTTSERIAKLKAERLAELKTAEDAQKLAEEIDRQQRKQRINASLGAALATIGAEWLMEFDTGKREPWECDGTPFMGCVFEVPDHNTITLHLEANEEGWAIPDPQNTRPWTVRMKQGGYFHLLADALIAADKLAPISDVIPF